MLKLLPAKMTTKMTIAVTMLVAVVLAIMAFTTLTFLQAEFKKAEHKRLATLASLLAEQVEDRIRLSQSMLKGIAALVPSQIADPAAINALLQGRPTALKQLPGGIFVANAHAEIIGSYHEHKETFNTTILQEAVRSTLGAAKPLISRPFLVNNNGQLTAMVYLTTPVRDGAGKVTGVVAGGMSSSTFNFLAALTDKSIGADAYVHIFTRNRTIVGHHDISKLLTMVPAGTNHLLDQIVSENANDEVTGEAITTCGVPALSSFNHLVASDWILEVGYPLAQVYAPFKSARNLFLLAGAAITLISMSATWIIMRYLTTPLHSLAAQMTRMREQNDTSPISISDEGEIGNVATAFNDLLQQLDKSRNELTERNSFLHALMDNLPTPVLCKNRESRIINCNRAYAQILELPQEKIIGKTNYDLFPESYATRSCATDQTVMESGQSLIYDTEFSLANGLRHFLVNKAPYRDAAGTIAGVVVSLVDITERTEAEATVRKARDFYLTLFEHFPSLIWRSGLDAKCNYFNQTWLNFTGRTLEEELGDGWTEGVHPEDFDRCLDIYLTGFNSRQEFDMEYRLRRCDGQYRWIQDMGRPFYDLDGAFAGFIGACFDITDNRELQRQVIEAQRMEAIGTLTGGIAHDFNNIMTVIQGHANLLQMRIGQDERLQRSVEQILNASARAAGLTQSLLLYSRKQISTPTVVDMNSIVNDMQGLLQGVFREDISLNFQLDPRQLPVKVDAGQMEQVIMNLFTNARDAMADGGEITLTTGSVQLSTEEADLHRLASHGGYCIVTIRDTGDGMDDETRRRIFEPFFTTKEVGKGTGLGLAVAFGIIINHNGQIECESQPGAGTVFHIYLPLADEEIARRQEIAPTPTSPARQESILVAEDDPLLRQLVRELLENAGYRVIEAVDGEEAIALFRSNAQQIDLALLDVIMPKVNGMQVYEAIHASRPDLKAIFLSGHSAEILGEKGIVSSEINYLSKPMTPQTLLGKIREVLDA